MITPFLMICLLMTRSSVYRVRKLPTYVSTTHAGNLFTLAVVFRYSDASMRSSTPLLHALTFLSRSALPPPSIHAMSRTLFCFATSHSMPSMTLESVVTPRLHDVAARCRRIDESTAAVRARSTRRPVSRRTHQSTTCTGRFDSTTKDLVCDCQSCCRTSTS
jgi:hypothetical protein